MDYLIYNLEEAHLSELADATLLSAEERAAATTRGQRYVLTRCLLRRELARRLDCPPQNIRFRIGEHGKPECEKSTLHFNISHSGNCLAFAFDSNAPIGIDVERIRPRTRLNALASRIMSPEQLTAFHERGCPEEEFYTCWCAAESLVKQAGSSIWKAGELPFLYEYGRIRLLRQSPLKVHTFTPMPGYMGAIAHQQTPPAEA